MRLAAAVVLHVLAALSGGALAHAGEQAPDEHRLDLSLGYADLAVRDEAATALGYHGTTAVGAVAYVGERTHVRWRVDLGAGGGPLVSAAHPDRTVVFASEGADGEVERVEVPMRGRQLALAVGAGAQARFPLPGDRWALRVGGRVGWDLAMPDGFARPGLYSLVGLRPEVGVTFLPHPRHELEVGFGQTVLGWMTRMPYHQSVSLPGTGQVAGMFRQGSGLRSPAHLIDVHAHADWRFQIHPRATVGVGYRFGWLSDDSPRPLKLAQHAVVVTARASFGGVR